MAVNDKKDAADPAGHWYKLPPLEMASLAISPEELSLVVEALTEEDLQKLLRMEVSFERTKGEVFACYDFYPLYTIRPQTLVPLPLIWP